MMKYSSLKYFPNKIVKIETFLKHDRLKIKIKFEILQLEITARKSSLLTIQGKRRM